MPTYKGLVYNNRMREVEFKENGHGYLRQVKIIVFWDIPNENIFVYKCKLTAACHSFTSLG